MCRAMCGHATSSGSSANHGRGEPAASGATGAADPGHVRSRRRDSPRGPEKSSSVTIRSRLSRLPRSMPLRSTSTSPVTRITARPSQLVIAQMALCTLRGIFIADRGGLVRTVACNGYVDTINTATGKPAPAGPFRTYTASSFSSVCSVRRDSRMLYAMVTSTVRPPMATPRPVPTPENGRRSA